MPIADFNPSTDLNGIRGAPSFWSAGATSPNQYLFAIGLHDRMYWFNYAAPKFSTSSPPQSDHEFTEDNGFIGGTASVTWNSLGSASTGVVWALDSNLSGILTDKGTYRAAGPAGLYIYPAIPPSPLCDNNTSICEIWDSTTDLPNYKTVMPGAVKFTVPTVVDGYVLIGGGSPGYFGTTACPAPTTPPFSCAGQLTILAIPPK
jgi:hypothetical protein